MDPAPSAGALAVLWLDAIDEGARGAVGAKAHTLAILRRRGLPVPDGFVVPAAARPDPRAIASACARLGGAVAVRSSAIAEDQADASFAGQFRTVLDVHGVDAVLAAIEECRAADGAAGAYSVALGLRAAESVPVLVQRFVEPRWAGVAFTVDPRDPGAMLVEAHAGRGEELVSGRVRPRRHVVDRATGAPRRGSAVAGLPAEALSAVIALARRAEDALGAPQDVEWAIGEEGPVLLQSRPITVEAEEPAPAARLTRENVGEVLPGPVTPLTETTVVAFLGAAVHDVLAVAGIPVPPDARFFVLYRRRLYLDLDRCLAVASRLPFTSPESAERLVLGGGSSARASPASGPVRPLLLARVLLRLLGLARRLPGELRAMEEALTALPSGPELDGADAVRGLRAFEAAGRQGAFVHIALSGACGVRLALLERVLARAVPGPTVERINRLVSGLPEVDSAEPAVALERLAAEVRAQRSWREWLDRGPALATRDLERGGAPAGFVEALRGFLDRYGHRGVSEGELAAPPWREDPAPVLAAMRALAARDAPPGFGSRAAAALRQAEEETVRSRLGPLARAFFTRALQAAQEAVRRREHSKALLVALVDHGRRAARSAGRRLAADGRLRAADDVFFLTLDELARALEGRPVPEVAIARRRRRHDREGALPAPHEVNLPADDPGRTEDRSFRRGLGVSGGVGLGPARVLRAGDPPDLAPGEVLIAPGLDAGLAPLLASAAGAVVELGGMLSHGSVVARELGVPCVADVRDATSLFCDGEPLLVDGTAGIVRRAPHTQGGPADTPARTLAPPEDADGPHVLEADPRARESLYFNLLDPESGLTLIATAAVRTGGRGEGVLALRLPDGRVLFAIERGVARVGRDALEVGGLALAWDGRRARASLRVAVHEGPGFPPGALPLLLAPRAARLEVDLAFAPTTPAVDFCAPLPTEARAAVRPLGDHHVEQSGRWTGTLTLDGEARLVEASGHRDHSWGLRDWGALDHSRLFTARFGDDLAFHALALGVHGRRVEGGFLWRDDRAEAVTGVREAPGEGGRFDLELTVAGGPLLRVEGEPVTSVTVPVLVDRRPWRHASGRPFRLVLHEMHARYRLGARVGVGIAERTERP